MSEHATEWEPGDPLYPHGSYRNYFFNFRDEPDETAEGGVMWGDPARWPNPLPGFVVTDDPIEAFIADHHAWQARQALIERVEQMADDAGLELLPHQRDVLDQALARRQETT